MSTVVEKTTKKKIGEIIRRQISSAAGSNLETITPGLCLQVVHHGKLRIDIRMGKTWKYYDLASLTKIIFTVPAMMMLAQSGAVRLSDPVNKYLPDWPHESRIKDVLSHSAGLSWWAPFYQKIAKRRFRDNEAKREFVKQELFRIPVDRQNAAKKKALYSDLDFILLGFLLEECLQKPLLEIWQNLTWRAHIPKLHFNSDNRPHFPRRQYAPTERCDWRKKILQGEVHDDNTWSFGGVSTHAGLFGRPDDVTAYGELLRAAFRGRSSHGFPSAPWVQKFTKRTMPVSKGDFALGFMLPTKGSASCGKYFSPSSFGHTGFTGTSLWYDPRRDLLVTLLSNRVHPTRDNRRFVELRPMIHDIVVESLNI